MRQADILLHANDYLEQINQNIDPLTGKPIPRDSILEEPAVRKALFFISEDLKKIVSYDAGQDRTPYTPDPERRALARAREEEIDAIDMANLINRTRNAVVSRGVSQQMLNKYLLDRGYLLYRGGVTEKGRSAGLRVAVAEGGKPLTLFGPQAQAMLLNNLDDLAEYCKSSFPAAVRKQKSKIKNPGQMRQNLQLVRSLSQGRNPLTGQALPPSDPAAQPRLKTCFSYIASALERSLEQGFLSAKKPFSLSRAEWERIPVLEEACTPAQLRASVNGCLTDLTAVQKITYPELNRGLFEEGFLTYSHTSPDPGAQEIVVTPKGEALGIRQEEAKQADGTPYVARLYSPEAQRYIIRQLERFVRT